MFEVHTSPRRQQTQNNVIFHWHHNHEKAFQSLKNVITTTPVLAHYSLTAKTKLVVDVSPWEVVVVLQKQADGAYRLMTYGNRSLTDVE